MPGRDLSAELFGNQQSQNSGRDLSGELGLSSQSSGSGPTISSLITGKRPPMSKLERVGQGAMDPINGGAQLLTHILPDSVVNAGNKLNNWLADKTGLVARIPEGGVDQMVRDQEVAYQARRKAGGESGFDGYRLLGNVVSPVSLGLGAAAPAGMATLAGRVGVGAASGAASGALSPVTSGDFWSEKGKQALTGAAVGGAIPALVGGAARLVSPNASKNANLKLLKDEGVQPTIGQALGGTANRVEEKLQSAPIVGDMISNARGRANSQFQTAAFNRALAPIGQTLPEGVAGRDAVVYTENALKQSYDDVLGRIGAVPTDETFANNVASLKQMVQRDVLSKGAKQKFQMVLNDVQSALDESGVLTSDAYKRVESSLGSDARKLASSQDIYDGRLAPAVRQLQAELRDLLQRQAGDSADDLQAVNSAWANFKRVQNAASKLGAEDGQFTPAQFQNAVRALDKSKDKGAFARGNALGQDLGDAGKAVLGGKVADSGTAGRALLNIGALGSSYLLNPQLAASVLGGAALYTSPVQRALVGAASSRPALAQPTAELLRKSAPYLVPAGAQLGLAVGQQ
jgi:hypothetical protein